MRQSETVQHRVVVAENMAACATCGTVVARRSDTERGRGRWPAMGEALAERHRIAPAATPPGGVGAVRLEPRTLPDCPSCGEEIHSIRTMPSRAGSTPLALPCGHRVEVTISGERLTLTPAQEEESP